MISSHNLSHLVNFLREIAVVPRKSLSQNFLIDENIVRKIIDWSEIKKETLIVEIGSGSGILTQALLNQGVCVLAIEKDRRLAQALYRLQTEDNRLIVVEGDVLNTDLSPWIRPGSQLISNLPYQITTPILTRFLPQRELFSSVVVMVQKEMAIRSLATEGTKRFNSFALFVQYYSHASLGFTVSPFCFYPRPKVESAMIKFELKKPERAASDEDLFFTMVRQTFQQRRKMVKNSLKRFYTENSIENSLKTIGKGSFIRPEELSLDEFLTLFEMMEKK